MLTFLITRISNSKGAHISVLKYLAKHIGTIQCIISDMWQRRQRILMAGSTMKLLLLYCQDRQYQTRHDPLLHVSSAGCMDNTYMYNQYQLWMTGILNLTKLSNTSQDIIAYKVSISHEHIICLI